MSKDWKAAWDPVIARIGKGDPLLEPSTGLLPDPVERGAIRKFLEPLEFDCALHYDPDVARAHGYPDVIAPCSSLLTFSLRPMWEPGTVLFDSDDRNAQPERTSVKPVLPDFFPQVTGYFATDMEFEFLRPVTVGDVVTTQAGTLVDCVPKEIGIGRGAFVTSETLIVNQHGETLGRMTAVSFYYNPHEDKAA